MHKFLILYFLITITITSQEIYFPPKVGNDWKTISSQELGWNRNYADTLFNYLESKKTKVFILLKDGKIVFEWYYNQFNKDSIWYWASAGKTLTASLVGIAQNEGFLKITDTTSKYLGTGWTSLDSTDENKIQIIHQLTMTSGLDDGVPDDDCTLKECLKYKSDPGTRWAYHNAPYTLLEKVVEEATGKNYNTYFADKIRNKIGMNGLWIKQGYNNVYFSNARSMARFGLLVYNNYVWDDETILNDQQYIDNMINTSQQLNKSYGYLWWLNGKGSYMLPQVQLVFNTDLIPEGPSDLIAALGKNDQKVYVAKSLGIVAIRMGEAADNPKLAVSSFDNELWERIMDVIDYSTPVEDENKTPDEFYLFQNYPNPFNPSTTIKFSIPADAETSNMTSLRVYDILGKEVALLVNEHKPAGVYEINFNSVSETRQIPSGIYFYQLRFNNKILTKKMTILK